MRRLLGTTLIGLILLSGCGEASDTAASPPATKPQLVSGTAAGGTVSTTPTVLEDAAAVRQYVAQFRGSAFRKELQQAAAAADVPPGWDLTATVVSIGCDVPTGVDVAAPGNDLVIRPQYSAAERKECFAPVTTVAIAVTD
ncbi:hypothetical protein ABLE68_03510 [Nocardioides sp. CN2-186]|uniref:hypothetical protein n=1 Tax=Nocardioides tweenelious TaxID=3156607 RepID=UPI0032B5BF5B